MNPSPIVRAKLHGRPAKVVALLVGIALLAGAFVTFRAALAMEGDKGVKYLQFGARPDACLPGQALPCLPDAGSGLSNRIYVKQNLVDGEYRYNEVVGTGHDGDVWLQTTLAGQCKSNYRLSSLRIDHHFVGDHTGEIQEVHEGEPPAPFPLDQPVDRDNRTIPTRNVAVHLPPEYVLDELLLNAPMDVFAWGENRIADRIAEGSSEHNARVEPSTFDSHVGLNAVLACRKVTNDQKRPYAQDSTWHPVRIVWLGVGMEPGDETGDGWRDALLPDEPTAPPTIDPELTVGFQVTQAHLSALSDEGDPCLLHLSAAVTTTEPGTVSYRYVNELGQRSQTFAVEVDQTLTAFFADQVELEPIVLDPPPAGTPDGLVAPSDGQIGGLVQEQGDNVQGYFQLEIVEPHTKVSNIASYNVDGCVTTSPTPDDIVAQPLPPQPDGSSVPQPGTPGVVVDPAPPTDPTAPPSDDLAPTPPGPTPPPSGPGDMTLAL